MCIMVEPKTYVLYRTGGRIFVQLDVDVDGLRARTMTARTQRRVPRDNQNMRPG